VAACQTWGTGLLPMVPSTLPLTTSTSPLDRTVVVGYQRPWFMSGWLCQELAAGL
jgi:hypothetical protein